MILAILSSSAAAQTTATYVGPNDGFWSDSTNWSIGQVPINDGGSTFNVIIPDNRTINFNVHGSNEITGLNLGNSAQITLSEGRALEVLGVTALNGLIEASDPDTAFLALSPFTSFVNNGRARAWVRDGALVSVNAPSYSGNFGGSNATVFDVRDPGSLLDLSSLSSFELPGSGYHGSRFYRVTASDGGRIDLSNVTNIRGAGGATNWAMFTIESDGQIDLDSLQSITGRTRFRVEVPNLDLPSLETVSGRSIFSAGPSNKITMPAVTSMSGASLEIDDGGIIEAPNLTTFTHGFIELDSSSTLITPPFTDFDHSRFQLRDGAVFDAIAASSYVGDFGGSSATVFDVRDPGSLLDLSSLSSFELPGSGYHGSRFYRVTASDGGRIDLSNVTNIRGAGGSTNWAMFTIESDGQIDLDSLQSITGRTRFRVEVPNLDLPSLETVSGRSIFSVATFNKISMPAVTSMSGASLEIDDGGTIEAPNLTTFTRGFIELSPTTFLSTPAFTDFDHSRFVVRDGAVFDRIAASSYVGDFGSSDAMVFHVTGSGSLLDLSSLSSFELPGSGYHNSRYYIVLASDGGLIDLSNVTNIRGASGATNWAMFTINTGGTIRFGDVEFSPGRSWLDVHESESRAEFLGSAAFAASTRVSLSNVATMTVAGNLTFDHTDEERIRLDDGILHMDGTSLQRLEVAGADLGLPSGSIDPNFHIGQLIVGQPGQATEVELVDWVDNGNRGPDGEREVLYLQGFPSENGLRILGDSTLYLNNLDAYAVVDGEWTHLNGLFPTGVTEIPFDEGYLNIGPGPCEPPPHCPVDWNCDGEVDINDFFAYLNDFADGNARADLNADGEIDINDFFLFLALFDDGC